MFYIYQNPDWHCFTYIGEKLQNLISQAKQKQAYLLGQMHALRFDLNNNATFEILSENIIKSGEIEGEKLNTKEVRSSVARKLGLDIGGEVQVSRHIEGVVEMMLDATKNFNTPITHERLMGWQAALFPTGYSGMHKILTGQYRDNKLGPMQVISGSIGREKVHYQAPDAAALYKEMSDLIDYVNNSDDDLFIKAGIAHLWFVILHPFDDGNGRVARALTDFILAKSDNTEMRFYSMSSQIQKNRNGYYEILEKTQRGSMDITPWLEWFLENLIGAFDASDELLADIIQRAEFWQKHALTNFNERQKRVLNRFMDDFEGHLTTMKWAKMCNCSQDTATNDINDLIAKKILKRVGKGRSVHYVLK